MEAQRPIPTMDTIIAAVATVHGVSPMEITSSRRTAEVMEARQAVYLVASELTLLSNVKIGRAIGDRDHTTVGHGIDAAREKRKADPDFAFMVDATIRAIGALPDELVAKLRAPNALDVAKRVDKHPKRETIRITAHEAHAMAQRVIDLEDVAAGASQLLALINRLALRQSRESLKHIPATAGLIETLTDQLSSLGYQQETTHEQQ